MKKKIGIFTSSRSDYGLLYGVIKGIHESKEANLLLYVGGTHLLSDHGKTINQIKKDKFPIKRELDFLLSSDTTVGIAKSMGLALINAADAFKETKPDILVVLGDRFECMSICQAAMIAKIPIAHIHGGETSQGALDEAARHSITKMSHLHFTSTETYKHRVIQLGENPSRVFNVGAPGIDYIKSMKFLSLNELSESINFDLKDKPFMVVTYHPVTLLKNGGIQELHNLLNALKKYKNHNFLITAPNADTHNKLFLKYIKKFKALNDGRVCIVDSLGQNRYLSALKHCDLTIGNSSSNLIEAPSLKIPSVNIGLRQKGRISGETVIHSKTDKESIIQSIDLALSSKFRLKCTKAKNPYGDGSSSKKILKILLATSFDDLVFKEFYDVNINR